MHAMSRPLHDRRCVRTPSILAVLVLAAGSGLACSANASRPGNWFKVGKSTDENLTLALDGRTADERRRGVNGLASGRDATSDDVLKVFDVIARTDTDAMVRVAALRGLRRSADARSVPTAVAILHSADTQTGKVRPAPQAVRWEAAKLLLDITHEYTYQETQRDEIVNTLMERLRADPDRNVRITAIETLAYFAQRPIPSALIDAMDTDDFAVQHAAEQALIALTGVAHYHDADAWRAWLAETPDPFERAGQAPPDLAQSRNKSWWSW